MSGNVPLDEEASALPKKRGLLSHPKKAGALRVTMFTMSGITLFLSPFMILAVIISSITSSDAPTGIPEKAFPASYTAAAIGIAAGIFGFAATALARKGSVLVWTLLGWLFVLATTINFFYLVYLGDRVFGPAMCLTFVILSQLVACICCTFMNAVKGLEPLGGKS